MLFVKNETISIASETEVREIVLKNIANLEEIASATTGKCPECGIPKFGDNICDVCADMICAVRCQPKLRAAQNEWEAENKRRVEFLKRQKES